MNRRLAVSTLLIMTALFLALVLPGGPIQGRDASLVLSPWHGLFVVVESGLCVAALVMGVLNMKHPLSRILIVGIGLLFCLINGFALQSIFSENLDEMDTPLGSIQITGMILSMLLVAYGVYPIRKNR